MFGFRKNLIVLTKYKLLSIDGILPLILELKARYPGLKPIFFIPGEKNLEIVTQNVHLKAMLDKIGAEIMCPSRSNKMAVLAWMLKFFLRLVFAKNIFLKFGDTILKHKKYLRIIKLFSHTIEVKCYFNPPAHDFIKGLGMEAKITHERAPEKHLYPLEIFSDDYEYFLSTLEPDDFKLLGIENIPREKILRIGYVRRLPAWEKFFHEEIEKYEPIKKQPYFFFVLPATSARMPVLDEVPLAELLEESLSILKKFNSEIHTIFKPHAITDIDVFKGILKKVGYENYTIDYGHPMILCSKAKFMIAVFYSTTMLDAYYLGIPILEYSGYDREFLKRFDNWSFGGRMCDIFIDRDKNKLEESVRALIDGKVSVKREETFINAEYPKPSEEFFELFKNF